jgi:hypothetical protein
VIGSPKPITLQDFTAIIAFLGTVHAQARALWERYADGKDIPAYWEHDGVITLSVKLVKKVDARLLGRRLRVQKAISGM